MEIRFNCIAPRYWEEKGEWFLPKGGDKMAVKTLREIPTVDDEEKASKIWLQMFNCGYRVTSSNIKWDSWNGCVYSDIDSKHYYNECKPFEAQKLEEALHEYLLINYNYNYYALQASNSGTGYHILFYFDVDRTESNFKKCAQKVREIVAEAFTNIGAKEIFEWPKVADNCSSSPYQGMYLTAWPWSWGNSDQPGFGSFEDIDTYDLEKERIKVSDIKKDGTKLFELDSYKPTSKIVQYKDHYQRWAIYEALIGVFGDRQKVDSEWENVICELLPEENGHSRDFYIKEPAKNKWYDRFSSDTIVKVNLLKEFGYSFKRSFEPIETASTYTPDVVYELKEGERLSDIKIDWDLKRFNHLYAGCSLGKTYNAKAIGAPPQEVDDVLDWIFGGFAIRQHKVCFISPMKSINKDAFENEENWVIIDTDHKFDVVREYGSITEVLMDRKINICTTWESYCGYEMWRYEFDFVIVDEIHILYTPDYRLKSIRDLKDALNKTKAVRIIMTGTPSYELVDFDCYKIQVKKAQKKVPAEIVFYHEKFTGYYMNDILEWTKDKDHYAILFDDWVNYKTEDLFYKYGLDCTVFNSKFTENVNAIIDSKSVISQITAFSVYGQAGINLYIEPDKKVRVYIPNSNGMNIIQYSNRIRNKEVIDKVVIGYKIEDITNDIKPIDDKVSYDDIPERVEQLNKILFYESDPMKKAHRSAIILKQGLNEEYLDKVDGKYVINESLYPIAYRIKQVDRYEKQIRVIYDRLVQNDFTVKQTYLDYDVPDLVETRLRSNTFAGQMLRINFDECMKEQKSGGFWFKPYDSLKKVCTGDLEETIGSLFNELYKMDNNGFEGAKLAFMTYVRNCMCHSKTVTKADIENFERVVKVKNAWAEYYDNSLVWAVRNNTSPIVTALYTRAVYKEGVDWKQVADEAYPLFVKFRRTVGLAEGILDNVEGVNKIDIENDELTQEIYDYIRENHTRGRKKKLGDVSRVTEWRRGKDENGRFKIKGKSCK